MAFREVFSALQEHPASVCNALVRLLIITCISIYSKLFLVSASKHTCHTHTDTHTNGGGVQAGEREREQKQKNNNKSLNRKRTIGRGECLSNLLNIWTLSALDVWGTSCVPPPPTTYSPSDLPQHPIPYCRPSEPQTPPAMIGGRDVQTTV